MHCYADDLQLYVHCRVGDIAAAAARLLYAAARLLYSRILEYQFYLNIDQWFGSNHLKMNPEKT